MTGITHTYTGYWIDYIILYTILILCCVCLFAWFANSTNLFHLCIHIFNLQVCVSVLCVQKWDPGGQGLFDQDRISGSQGCPRNAKPNECVLEVHTHFSIRRTRFTFRSLVEYCVLSYVMTPFENKFHGSSTAWKQICLFKISYNSVNMCVQWWQNPAGFNLIFFFFFIIGQIRSRSKIQIVLFLKIWSHCILKEIARIHVKY